MPNTTYKSSVKKLQKRSNTALGAITQLIHSLRDTNERIEAEKALNRQKIEQIEHDQSDLDAMEVENARIVANFECLLGKS